MRQDLLRERGAPTHEQRPENHERDAADGPRPRPQPVQLDSCLRTGHWGHASLRLVNAGRQPVGAQSSVDDSSADRAPSSRNLHQDRSRQARSCPGCELEQGLNARTLGRCLAGELKCVHGRKRGALCHQPLLGHVRLTGYPLRSQVDGLHLFCLPENEVHRVQRSVTDTGGGSIATRPRSGPPSRRLLGVRCREAGRPRSSAPPGGSPVPGPSRRARVIQRRRLRGAVRRP
jgi:hypothetical protein